MCWHTYTLGGRVTQTPHSTSNESLGRLLATRLRLIHPLGIAKYEVWQQQSPNLEVDLPRPL